MDKADVQHEYEQFLYNEALLMDGHRYSEWLELWDSECVYWAPLNEEESPPEDRISLIYEDRGKLEDRVARLASKAALAQSPKSRLMRTLSNIVVVSSSDESISGSAHFIIGESRYDQQQVWFGRAEYELVRTGTGLKIRRKKVIMLNNDMTMGNMSFLV